ncbi:MAG TPA: type II toxin-antitoxin system RelE/ParE family toxin [Acidobacteriaceae bacterium]
MAWRIELSTEAEKQLAKLDKQTGQRIGKFLSQRVAPLDNPRSIGSALQGERYGELWRYRVGDYRIICKIYDDRLVIAAVRIGHRREVYR